MNATATAFPNARFFALAASGRKWAWAAHFWRGLVFCSLFSLVLLPEYFRDEDSAASFVYDKALGGFRYIDLAILALVLLHLIALTCSRAKQLRFPRALVAPGICFLACIAAAIFYGHTRGGTNFFFDWRALALAIGLYFVWAFWIQTPSDLHGVAVLFAVYMALRIAVLFALYFAGRADALLGVPTPTYDGPALSAIVFTALLALRWPQDSGTVLAKLFWMALAAAACLLVLLCFRRTYWGELAIGFIILLFLQPRHRIRNCVLVGTMMGTAALVLGGAFSARLQSLDFTQINGAFSVDNSDHLHDLLDAWDQVQQSPVMGIGLGTSYPTWRIRNWKNDSVMVHNAPIHVWLKYGILGLLCYLWFHIALLRCLYQRSRNGNLSHRAFLDVALAYLTAQFAMTLGFVPWPYAELQLTTLISFILAAVFMTVPPPSPANAV
jgi:O-antigen ligase